nr:MAG TPA: hypothetical protein [Caudoviricetes sp.]
MGYGTSSLPCCGIVYFIYSLVVDISFGLIYAYSFYGLRKIENSGTAEEREPSINKIMHLRAKMLFRDFHTLSERLKLLTHPNQGDRMHAETNKRRTTQ